jgi:hypothetical protein
LQQLNFKRGAIGLGGATSKLLNVKSRHGFELGRVIFKAVSVEKTSGRPHLFVDSLCGDSFHVTTRMSLLPVPR